jgi:hypothetical protein
MTRMSAIRHTTPANRGVFRDLGFDEAEAKVLEMRATDNHARPHKRA